MKFSLDKFGLRFNCAELSGSLGDLGIFLPLAAGLAVVCEMNLGHIFFFAGAMNIASGLMFKIPIPVQPMKVIAAVAIAERLSSDIVIAAGIIAGVIILFFALTGLINVINKLIPKTVVRGLQLAIGIKLLLSGIYLIAGSGKWIGLDSALTAVICFSIAITLISQKKTPVALIIFIIGIVIVFSGNPLVINSLSLGWTIPRFQFPSGESFLLGFWQGALPQIPLTILNSVIAVCALSIDLFPHQPLKPKKVAMSIGLMNLISCTFGGMPMCHGAGGLAAQYQFGARTGGSVVFLGTAKILLAVTFGGSLLTVISVYPGSVLGVLLVFSAWTMVSVCRDVKVISHVLVMILTASACLFFGIGFGFLIGYTLALIMERVLLLTANSRLTKKIEYKLKGMR